MPNLDHLRDVPEYLKNQFIRMAQNISRVNSLIDLHEHLSGIVSFAKENSPDPGNLPDPDDILRAATVLLHASLEDFLRSIALDHFPMTPETLNPLPFAGMGNRAEKIKLGDLVAHREKTVDQLLGESINQWLNHFSFNNCDDISRMLRILGIEPAKCNASFGAIDEMIARRHRIVHYADRVNGVSPSTPETNPISEATVATWRDAVQRFMQAALYELQFVVEGVRPNES